MKIKLHYIILTIFSINMIVASDLRIESLGGNAGFWPEDDQNIMMFPSTINEFNLAQIQDAAGENPYATFIFGDNAKYGFMLDGEGDNLLNLAYGTGDLGVILGFDMDGSNEWVYDDASNGNVERKPSSMALNAMVGLNSGFGEVGLGLNFMSSDNDNGNSDDDPGTLGLGLNLRREQSLWVFSHLLVSANFGSGKMELVEEYYDEEYNETSVDTSILDMSSLSLEASLFRHWDLGSETDLLFAAGLGFGSLGLGPDSVKITQTNIVVPNYTFAVETNVADWATLRVGVNNSHLLSSTVEAEGSDQKMTEMGTTETNYSVGLGLEYEGFKLDLDLNPEFLTNPVHYITGNNSNSGLATKATVTFTF